MKKDLGIYIHIPFCVRKCAYCDFLSAPGTEEVQNRYLEVLRGEIRSCRELGARYRAATVFFGGGTPSILPGEKLMGILEEIGNCFEMADAPEITVECNPGTLTEEKLIRYREAGVNRLSIGLQSASDEELRALGRIHTWDQFLESYRLARKIGFANLNVDLMSALPGQSRESWLRTLEQVLELSPEHISAYSLIIEEGTPFYERFREGGPEAWKLPDEDTERRMYYDTGEVLAEAGYEHYEISNYAKPGFACRHNRSYWERTDYKGFGLGAASLLDNVREKNGTDLEAYLRGEYVPESRECLSRKEQLEETMFLGLRKMDGVFLTEELLETYEPVFRELEREKLLVRREGRARLTGLGIDVSNYALAKFLMEQ